MTPTMPVVLATVNSFGHDWAFEKTLLRPLPAAHQATEGRPGCDKTSYGVSPQLEPVRELAKAFGIGRATAYRYLSRHSRGQNGPASR
jgi:hypothetical protein